MKSFRIKPRLFDAKTAAVVMLSLVLSGCASGTKFRDLTSAETEARSDNGQIVVYRSQKLVGAAWQPTVYVDGRETGKCTANGVFIVDVAPGTYSVSSSTETESKVVVDVAADKRVYVRCAIGIGVFAGRPKLEQVDDATGITESGGLAFTGRH